MSTLNDLLEELCPDGVEYKRLGDVVAIKNGRSDKGTSPGAVPVYGSGGVMRMIDDSLAEGPSVLVPRKGSLDNLFYVEGSFWNVDTIFRTEMDPEVLVPKFLYYHLSRARLSDLNTAGGVPSLTQALLNELRLPVPPVPVQDAVVSVLDAMKQLEAELEAELEARRAQFDHYRDSLCEQSTSECRPLRELGTFYGGLTGKGKRDFECGDARYVTYMEVFANPAISALPSARVRIGAGERQNRIQLGDILFTTSSESAAEVGMSSVVTCEPEEPVYLNSFCFGFRPKEGIDLEPEYAKHLFRSSAVRRQIVRAGNGVTRINISRPEFFKIVVSFPGKSEQLRRALTLDLLDSLTGDLSVGLPAEIAARRKQYEHYRDTLLTFPEKTA